LLGGRDPLRLKGDITSIEADPAWQFFVEKVKEEIAARKSKVFHTIENDSNKSDHNRNVVTTKTLESVLELFQAARKRCDEELK